MVENLNSTAKKLRKRAVKKKIPGPKTLTSKLQKDALGKRLVKLESENLDLKNKIKTLQIERPKLSSKKLISSFGDALGEMQESLDTGDQKTKYIVSNLEINLKANVTYGDNKIYYQLPKLEDVIPLENLSTIRFNMKVLPKIEKDIFDHDEVPDLLGLKKKDAEGRISKNGFNIGEIKYAYSEIESDTVIDQLPSPLSIAPPKSPIDLVLSKIKKDKINKIKVPALVGLSFKKGAQILDSQGLLLGKVTKRASNSPEGTVISQSITAGKVVGIGTPIDVILAETKRSRVIKPLSVTKIKGIGRKYALRLEKAGITTISKLSASSIPEIAKVAGVSKRVAKVWKDKASSLIKDR